MLCCVKRGFTTFTHRITSQCAFRKESSALAFSLRFQSDTTPQRFREDQIPRQADVLIVGGGLVGWATAYWLRQTTKYSVTIVERDPTYARSASVLGLGSIRQQFSEPEHIQMSLFGSSFMREVKEYLSTNGYENEGWFDPWLLLKALRAKCHTLGVNYVVGELVGFEASSITTEISFPDMPSRPPVLGRLLREAVFYCEPLHQPAKISSPDEPELIPITFSMVVNATGPWAANVAQMAEIGTSENLHIPLPIEPRLRPMFVVRPKEPPTTATHSSDAETQSIPQPGLDTPFLIDPSGLVVQRRGLSGEFIVYSDSLQGDQAIGSLENKDGEFELDSSQFGGQLSQLLGHRIPSLASAEK